MVSVITFIALFQHASDSTRLTARIETTLSEALGHDVVLLEPARLQSVFPSVQISAPKISSNGVISTAYRMQSRIENASISLSPFALLAGSVSDLHIQVDSLAFTLEPLETRDAIAGPEETNTPPDFNQYRQSLAEALQALDARVDIAQSDIIVFTRQAGYKRWNATDITGETDVQDSTTVIGELRAGNVLRLDSTGPKEPLILQADWAVHGDSRDMRIESNVSLSPSSTTNDKTADSSEEHLVHLNVQLHSQDNFLSLKQLTVESPSGLVNFEGDVPAIDNGIDVHGQLTVDLDLANLVSAVAPLAVASESDARRFDYKPFETGIPHWLNINIVSNFANFTVGSSTVLTGTVSSVVKGGDLLVSSEDLSILGGDAQLSLGWSSANRFDTSYELDIKASNMDLERVRSPEGLAPVLDRGTIDVNVQLQGRGPSPGHLAASTSGSIQTSIDRAQLNRRNTTALDRGLVSWALERLSVTSSRVTADSTGAHLSDPLAIDCASLRLDITDGRARAPNGVIVELLDNTLYGSGFVDLHNETLGMAFRTRRKSLFDWSAISIVRYIEVGGKVVNPEISLNTYELARQGVLSASSVAWGPLPAMVYSMAEAGLKNRRVRNCLRSID